MTVTKARPRIGLEVLVSVLPKGGRPHLGRTTNLSTTGMLLEIGEALEVGGQVRLKLFLPGTRKKLELDGEVTRDAGVTPEGFRYGLRFLKVPAESEGEIGRFLSVRLQRQAGNH